MYHPLGRGVVLPPVSLQVPIFSYVKLTSYAIIYRVFDDVGSYGGLGKCSCFAAHASASPASHVMSGDFAAMLRCVEVKVMSAYA